MYSAEAQELEAGTHLLRADDGAFSLIVEAGIESPPTGGMPQKVFALADGSVVRADFDDLLDVQELDEEAASAVALGPDDLVESVRDFRDPATSEAARSHIQKTWEREGIPNQFAAMAAAAERRQVGVDSPQETPPAPGVSPGAAEVRAPAPSESMTEMRGSLFAALRRSGLGTGVGINRVASDLLWVVQERLVEASGDDVDQAHRLLDEAADWQYPSGLRQGVIASLKSSGVGGGVSADLAADDVLKSLRDGLPVTGSR